MARHTAKSHKIRKVEILVIQMGIFSAISIGQTIYRKHRLGADDTLYCKSVYAWTPIGESRLVLIDRRII